MQDYGYPSPPTSPGNFDHARCGVSSPPPLQQQSPPQFPRPVPLDPEERLGQCLEGKLQLVDILGTGAYGVVYSAVDVKSGVRYAVKCLSKFNPDGTPLDRRQVSFQNREIRLHYLASAHRNIVSMLKIVDDPDCIYVILEYCPEGDLFYNITERGHYVGQDELSRRIFLQILDAVEHCHSLRIYHRDLKPENILVSDNGETVKLADFGLATSSDRSEDYGCGSTFYMSPECLDHSTGKPFYMCAPNDVWSLGVVLVNLTCGRNPWKQASLDDSTYRAYTHSRDYLKSILPVSDELNEILATIFTANPDQRITLPELRARILACPRFTTTTASPTPTATATAISTTSGACAGSAADPVSISIDSLPSPPIGPPSPDVQVINCGPEEYADGAIEDDDLDGYEEYEECVGDDDDGYDSPLSPASSVSDDGSLTSSVSSMEDFDEEDLYEDQQQQHHHHHEVLQQSCPSPLAFEPEMQLDPAPASFHQMFHPAHEFVPQHYMGPVPAMAEHKYQPQHQHHQHQHHQHNGQYQQQQHHHQTAPIPLSMPAQASMVPQPMHIHVQIQVQVQVPVPVPCHPHQHEQHQQQLKSYFPWDLARFGPVMQGIPFYSQVPNFFPVFQMS